MTEKRYGLLFDNIDIFRHRYKQSETAKWIILINFNHPKAV